MTAPCKTLGEAMALIRAAAGTSALTPDQVVAIALRGLGIYHDGAECLSAPIPPDWSPTAGTALVAAFARHGLEIDFQTDSRAGCQP